MAACATSMHFSFFVKKWSHIGQTIYIPTQSFEDWNRLLAQPDLHWKAGYSAMTLARSWEAAQGFPPEVAAALATATDPLLQDLSVLIAIPEYQVALPGGERASQTDLLVLARGSEGLVAIAVEGKVDETFGPTVEQKRAENSKGVNTRLQFLMESLGLAEPVPGNIRYQLLHRTVSALLIAEQFSAKAAGMGITGFFMAGCGSGGVSPLSSGTACSPLSQDMSFSPVSFPGVK